MYATLKEALTSFTGILIVLAALFILQPLLEGEAVGIVVLNFVFTFLLLSGICVVHQNAITQKALIFVAIPSFLLRWLWYFKVTDSLAFLELSIIFDVIYLLAVSIAILSYILGSRQITIDMLSGAISVYFLLGIMFGYLFSLIELHQPNSFHLPEGTDINGRNISVLIYFSFVTLTTLGYGDATPITEIARSVVIIEAILGQMFIAVLVGQLVGMRISQNTTRS